MMLNRSYCGLTCLCIVLTLAGCTLQEVKDQGDKCPPSVEKEKTLSYVYGNGEKFYSSDKKYTEEFQYGNCPHEYPSCVLDTKGEFYCMASCDPGQVSCDGRCIDPKTDTQYCGAVNESCDDFLCCKNGVACKDGEVCNNGTCMPSSCQENSETCIKNAIYKCDENGQFSKFEDCESGLCGDDNSCLEVCKNGKIICQNGSIYKCAKDKWELDSVCESGSCNDEKTECGETHCESGKKACRNNSVYSCEDDKLIFVETCPIGSNCVDGVCKEGSVAACNVSVCSNDGEHLIYEACIDNVLQAPVTCQNNEECSVNNGCIECKAGEYKCDGDVFMHCEGFRWVVEDCAAVNKICSEYVGCYTCNENEQKCSPDGAFLKCVSGQWTVDDCSAQLKSCDKDAGCYSCKNGEKNCTDFGVFESCVNLEWTKDDCSAKGMSCSKEIGCFSCENGDKKCINGVFMSCQNNVWVNRDNCAEQSLKCDDTDGCYECVGNETDCTSLGVFRKCVNRRWVDTNCADQNMICSKDNGCMEKDGCMENNTIYVRHSNGLVVYEHCANKNMICDNDKGCVSATISCTNNKTLHLSANGKNVDYDCSKNESITASIYGLPGDINEKTLCNPLSGCDKFYCENNVLYTYDYDSGENCKDNDNVCNNTYPECVECFSEGFKPFCDIDMGNWYIACDEDHMLVWDDECWECNAKGCTERY